MMKRVLARLAAAAFALAPITAAAQGVGVELVTDDLDQPTYLTSPPGDPRLFILERTGSIMVVENGQLLATPFLTIPTVNSADHEQGLLGLAFHPRYASNGRFFVYYTDAANRGLIVEYRASSDPNRAAPDSARIVLAIDRPTARHNGGWLGFGPDGLLYVTSGDGDGFGNGDRWANGQNPASLMGKVFRLHVDGGGPIELVAYGLRNPWRASFDGNTLWLGDVGHTRWEEINRLTIGSRPPNFGWVVMEGAHCFRASDCDTAGYVAPVYEYSHREGCAVTGGYVYRGSTVPALRGHYLFADWCTGFVRSIDGNDQLADWTPWLGGLGNVTSFGVDARGELYIVIAGNGPRDESGGAVYRIVAR
jgi:glucose/arabinose dehydrogenase